MRVSLNIPATSATLSAALEGLTAVNFCLLKKSRKMPALYSSGVRYKREAPGTEEWLTAPQVLAAGTGDCEDLSAWRAAELRLLGIPARAVVVRTGAKRYHAVVLLPNGTYEDPSKKLGMRTA
jgi:hypothetical protein